MPNRAARMTTVVTATGKTSTRMPGSGSTRRARPTGNAALSASDPSIPTSTPTTRAGATPSTPPVVRSAEEAPRARRASLWRPRRAMARPSTWVATSSPARAATRAATCSVRASTATAASHRRELVLEGHRHQPVLGIDLLQGGLGPGQPTRVDPELGCLHHVGDVGAVGPFEARQQRERREGTAGQIVGNADHGDHVGVDGGAGEVCLVGEHRIVLRPLRDVRRRHRAETEGAPDIRRPSPPSTR